jgi:preprotein translocase SecF subunit
MFRGLNFVPADTKIPFLAFRKVFLVISATLIVGSILLVLFKGLNFGIDFRGGILMDIKTAGPADLASMRQSLSNLGLGEVGLQEFGDRENVLIRLQRQPGGEAAQQEAISKVRDALGPSVEYRRVEQVGPQVSNELLRLGMLATALSLLGIIVYIWFRFEWQFAIGATIAELHDVITTLGLFALLGLDFNLTSVAALLTIAGYSINDTVVVYDRVRENLRKYKTMPLDQLLDLSLNQTLSRTINTAATVVIALLALYFFGGEVLRGFSIAMLWGAFIGIYSTLGAAVPILIYFKLRPSTKPAGDVALEVTGDRG